MLPSLALILLLQFLDGYTWLRNTAIIYQVASLGGGLMVVTAGGMAVFQKNLGRIFAYGVVIEIGFSLIAIGLWTRTGLEEFSQMFAPRLLEMGLWALALSIFKSKAGSLDMDTLGGALHQYPFATAGIMMAAFSTAGLPLTASFPVRMPLILEVAGKSPALLFVLLVGMGAFLVATLLMLVKFAVGGGTQWKINESWSQIAFLVTGILFLLAIGFAPNAFLSGFPRILQAFGHLR